MDFSGLSNDEVLAGVRSLVASSRILLTNLLAYLAEVEDRRLHLAAACSSMFDFCVRRLGMSEGEACRRISAARVARRFPTVLGRIARGELNLSSVALLRDYLTDENHVELFAAAAHKTKREVQQLIASRFAPPGTTPSFLMQFAATAELRERIEYATSLLRHRNPGGDLAVVIEQAIELLVTQLEKERLAKNARTGKRATIREVFERDGVGCIYTDEHGNRCGSRDFLELDHIDALAQGGAWTPENLRVFCRAHNKHHAELVFGRDFIARKIEAKRGKGGGTRKRAGVPARKRLRSPP